MDINELKTPDTHNAEEKSEGKKKFKKKNKKDHTESGYGLNLTLGELFHTDDPKVKEMFSKKPTSASAATEA